MAAGVSGLPQPDTEEVSPEEAWQMLREIRSVKLVDVRTVPEWLYVGLPDIGATAGTLLQISWHIFPGMKESETFVEDLKEVAAPNDVLLFLCRSGGRSLAAARAAKQAGFKQAYSIRGGFEGPPNEHGHRGHLEGWKCAKLAWRQQ